MSDRSLRILHAIHDYLPRHQAGSELYAHALVQAQLARGHQATVVCASYDLKLAHGHMLWRIHEGVPVAEITNNWASESFADTYRDPVIAQRLQQVLDEVKPDIVHIHNLLNLSFDLPRMAKEAGARVVATLHDYTLVCASGGQRLHRAESHVCHVIETDRCARCFSESVYGRQAAFGRLKGGAPGALSSIARAARAALPLTVARISGRAPGFATVQADLDQRMDAARAVFEAVDLFVAPSPSIAREYAALGLSPNKIRVSDYGFPARRQPDMLRTNSARMRIGFIGTPVYHKGAHVLLDAVKRLPANAVDLTIVGDLEVAPEYTAELRHRAAGLRVTFTGRIPHADVSRHYDRLDVLVVPSLWLENSPLVIHEAFAAGVPVVGSNLGGIPDLVKHEQNGLLFEPGNPLSLAQELRRLLTDPDLLPRLSAGRATIKSIDDDATEWDAAYDVLLHAPAWS